MCGIAGLWTRRLTAEDAIRRVASMTAALKHRGPDDEGIDIVSSPPANDDGLWAVFGHRRLSILDLSSAGHQPMLDPVTRNWITYNGEIFNFPELRSELERSGHHFRTRCDTEVILKAYAEWGAGAWRRLRGMYAFAIWNAKRRCLHLVRDQLGIKPLYYGNVPQGMAFASEVRAVLASRLMPGRLSMDALQSYLKYGSVQEPCSMVAGIGSVPPGHCLSLGQDGASALDCFWSVDRGIAGQSQESPPTGRLLDRLQDSVGRQLVSDVSVGVFLSGGIDSAAIAALASRAQPGNVRTFCIGSEDQGADESAEASATALSLGCRHTTLVLEGSIVRDNLDRALASYDQPSVDGINTYFISQLVRNAGIKVALSGLGGDEIFAGYFGFRKALMCERMARILGKIPAFMRSQMGGMVGAQSRLGSGNAGMLAELLRPDLPAPYFASRLLFSRRHSSRLLSGSQPVDAMGSSWENRERALAVKAAALGAVNRASFLELQCYMLSTLLRDSDQMSMAHALELRVPFVDPEIVEAVLPISGAEKVKDGNAKRLLKQILADIIPADVLARPKRGFGLPFREWLLRDLKGSIEERFLGAQPRGPWNLKAYRQVWLDFQRGRITWSRVFALFTLENWLQQNDISA